MKDKSRFKKLSEGLRQRTQEAYDTREDRRRDILDRSKISNYPLFDPGMGDHLIDFLPYECGPNDPIKAEGSAQFFVDLYVHRRIGPNEDNLICPYKTYGKPCPICEHRDKLRKLDEPSSEDERNKLKAEIELCRPKRYSVYAIWDRDNESKGVQLWTIAHWFVQMNLMAACRDRKTKQVIPFAAPDKEEGRSVAFEISGGKMSQQFKGWQLVERDEDIPDEILDNVPVLDDLLDIPSYEEIKKAFWAGLSNGKDEPAQARSVEEPKAPVKGDTNKCPIGETMGRDFEKYEECLQDCEQYNACYELYKSMGLETDENEESDEEFTAKQYVEPDEPQRPRPQLRGVPKEPEETQPRRRRRE